MASRHVLRGLCAVYLMASGAFVSEPALAQNRAMPPGTFSELAHPTVPDYSDRDSWAALPDREDAADVWPRNSSVPEAQADAPVDVFYIHPTTYQGVENWNQDLSMDEVNTWTDITVMARQASAFNGCCKIYAPRYRQATIMAMAAQDNSGTQAYDLAYQDVLKAWKYYLDNWNDGRPFMIVSHSQGTLHAIKLLEEEIDGTPLADRMVAGYIVGIGINEGLFGRSLKTITRCTGATDTGCVASWNTFGRDGDPSAGVARLKQRYQDRFGTPEGEEIACWNPVGWTDSSTDVPASANLGSLPGSPAVGARPDLTTGYGAQCKDGSLYTDIPTGETFDLVIFDGDNLHMHDFDLFYENIRVNAVARMIAYFEK
ncbi:MAG: DUF3089 domain-containing protein [Rhodospirillaceae bacterium]